jgi:outer membrane protein assembly factor BamB
MHDCRSSSFFFDLAGRSTNFESRMMCHLLRVGLQLAAIWAVCLPALLVAQAPTRHRLMFFEYGNCPNRFVELDTNGNIVREFKPRSIAVIFQRLANGNIVYAYGGKPTGVVEVNAHNETVWNYVSQCPQVLGCERLSNGNTLVAEQGPCQVVEVDPNGKVVHITGLFTNQSAYHLQVRNVHRLDNGDILAAHEGDGAIREYAPDGRIVWQYTGVENTGDARRLADGNTLIGGGTQKRLIEVSPDGKIVWEFKAADAPAINLTWVSSVQVLKNGNYLVGNFLRGHEEHGAHAFEVTRGKKVVWTFADHKQFKSVTTVRAVDE